MAGVVDGDATALLEGAEPLHVGVTQDREDRLHVLFPYRLGDRLVDPHVELCLRSAGTVQDRSRN